MDIDNAIAAAFDREVQQFDFAVSASQRQQLLAFLALLQKWNKAYNLTSVRDPMQMLYSHILDSIAVTPHLQQQRYIDVGTGPGLPGIPLAIMHPDKHFVLLDSLGKRVRFMTQAVHSLKLENAKPMQSRVENYQPEQAFDAVLTRAFASIKDMLHCCQHLVDSQGIFLALKGQYPTQELQELPEGFQLQADCDLHVPGLQAERHLITLSKH